MAPSEHRFIQICFIMLHVDTLSDGSIRAPSKRSGLSDNWIIQNSDIPIYRYTDMSDIQYIGLLNYSIFRYSEIPEIPISRDPNISKFKKIFRCTRYPDIPICHRAQFHSDLLHNASSGHPIRWLHQSTVSFRFAS